jgi:hypothetical protein
MMIERMGGFDEFYRQFYSANPGLSKHGN